jgi:DNA modification methylase
MGILYYGDNLEILRNKIQDETIDLCYIDPPFNSKRSYFQIYNAIGGEKDKAQAQAFVDTWKWDTHAIEGHQQIISNFEGRFTRQSIELIRGLELILGKSDLFAYLVSMTLRITEIYRVLKPTGSFYLHCDPTASHYLKLMLDAVFCSQGGDFRNEIVWCYETAGKSKKTVF